VPFLNGIDNLVGFADYGAMRSKTKDVPRITHAQMEVMKALPQLSFSKATLRQVQIIEAAIHCYAHFGTVESTFDRIAKQAKLSRPLIFHYFSDKNEIFDATIKYVRATYQQLVVEGIEQGRNAKERFQKYVEYCFVWLERYPTHIKLWLLFLQSSSIHDNYRKMNSEFVAMGLERIGALIAQVEGNSQLSAVQVATRARLVQALITGGIIQMSSEDASIVPKDFVKNICKETLSIATAK
jgi:AcrR family transcriptional regulator